MIEVLCANKAICTHFCVSFMKWEHYWMVFNWTKYTENAIHSLKKQHKQQQQPSHTERNRLCPRNCVIFYRMANEINFDENDLDRWGKVWQLGYEQQIMNIRFIWITINVEETTQIGVFFLCERCSLLVSTEWMDDIIAIAVYMCKNVINRSIRRIIYTRMCHERECCWNEVCVLNGFGVKVT